VSATAPVLGTPKWRMRRPWRPGEPALGLELIGMRRPVS
jgi:hypothetical protein